MNPMKIVTWLLDALVSLVSGATWLDGYKTYIGLALAAVGGALSVFSGEFDPEWVDAVKYFGDGLLAFGIGLAGVGARHKDLKTAVTAEELVKTSLELDARRRMAGLAKSAGRNINVMLLAGLALLLAGCSWNTSRYRETDPAGVTYEAINRQVNLLAKQTGEGALHVRQDEATTDTVNAGWSIDTGANSQQDATDALASLISLAEKIYEAGRAAGAAAK